MNVTCVVVPNSCIHVAKLQNANRQNVQTVLPRTSLPFLHSLCVFYSRINPCTYPMNVNVQVCSPIRCVHVIKFAGNISFFWHLYGVVLLPVCQ